MRLGVAADTDSTPGSGGTYYPRTHFDWGVEMAAASKRVQVLVVDDAPAMRAIAAFTLEGMGAYEVEAVDCAEAALDALGAHPFDAMITDFGMERVNGIQLVEAVRAMPAFEHLPIVMMAFEDDPRIREAATMAGVDAFVAKPLDPDDIRETLQRLLPEPEGALPTASGYMLLGVQSVLDSMPHPAMLMDEDHQVMLGNRAFFQATGARFHDCGLRCASVMHADGEPPEDCPLTEAVRTGNRVERLVAESVAGPVEVCVYPTDVTDGEGKRLYLHLARPATSGVVGGGH